MSTGVEGSKRLDVRARVVPQQNAGTDVDSGPEGPSRPASSSEPKDATEPRVEVETAEKSVESQPHDHPLLIDAHEDRWRWRRKIREDPRKLFFYRICVAVLGVLLLCLAAITGPLPGPGGIPIAILGIAVWSSEFEWAQRLLLWFKAQLNRYQALPRSRRVLIGCVLALCAVIGVYVALLRFGVPFWMPEFIASWLRHLPGV